MKPLVCEMCSSHDLIKQGGVFVCQHCGTKYSVEEARKMMFDGSIKIDNTDKLEKLYQIARRAKADNNIASAGKYYDLILQEDPMSWEATFYTTYYASIQTNISGIHSAENTISNSFHSVLQLIDASSLDIDDKKKAIREIRGMVQPAAAMFYRASMKHYAGIGERIRSQYAEETFTRILSAAEMLFILGDQIKIVFSGQRMLFSEATVAWEAGLKLLEEIKKLNYNLHKLTEIEKLYINKITQNNDDENTDVKRKHILSQIEELNKIVENTPKVHNRNIALYIFSIIMSFICMLLDAGTFGTIMLLLCVIGLVYQFSQKPINDQKIAEAITKRSELEKQLSAMSKKGNC